MTDRKLSDNEKIYRGCVIGMTENTIDDLHAIAYDLESCPGIASDEEIDQIYEMAQKLRDLNKRLTEELKRYGLKVNP